MNPGWVPSARSVAAMEVSNAFGDYGNCVWFVIVTMTTTGWVHHLHVRRNGVGFNVDEYVGMIA